ncbi:MAG: flagellar biosynthetic protein FliR [Pseudomonadota bacterium]
MSLLEQFLVGNVLAFILVFVRIGTAMMILPGIGDSFTPRNIRLYIALAISVVLTPFLSRYIPTEIPSSAMLFTLIFMEFLIGLFFGTIARIFMTALDTAGMVISLSTGLANAQLFNPIAAGQGSLMGAFLSVTGVCLVFAANLHHLLIYGLVDSYEGFPVGGIPDVGSMAEMVTRAVSSSFLIGVQIATPFLAVALLIYIGMGVLTRLMPQIQVFILALPVQIMLGLITMALAVSTAMLFWLGEYEETMTFFLTQIQ